MLGFTPAKAAGIEPEGVGAATSFTPNTYVTCTKCGAANALHGGNSKWRTESVHDARLQTVIAAWDTLPDRLRAAIVAIASSPE